MSSFLHAHHPEIYAAVDSKKQPVEDKAAFEEYRKRYEESIADPEKFWASMASKYLTWFTPYTQVLSGSFQEGDIAWFLNGRINACYNCVDRHLPTKASQVAIIWEGDEPGETRKVTYGELFQQVCRIANVLKENGVRKGDCVTIYLPMIPEVAMVMLACARIGAIHSVVFAGFSAESVKDRIVDCSSRFVITATHGRRGGKSLALKTVVDTAVSHCPAGLVEKVFVFQYPGSEYAEPHSSLEVRMTEAMSKARPYCAPEWLDSEDILFILYTSGSTGKPKGLAHSTAGYLVHAAMTTHNSFNIQEGDIFGCVADAGWITGHTYIIYGPLLLGTTTVMFESIPTYPNPYRYWDVVQRHKLTQFYTAPTAVRALMRFDPTPIASYDLSSLRVLGTVGEPINPEAWRWYFNHVGHNACSLSDTYWQTETGGHVASNLPGIHAMKPGSCAVPYYGIEFALIDPQNGQELQGNNVEGVLCIKKPWPSIARTVYGDHERYLNVYMKPYAGYYFTSDGARRDSDGYYWITGRVDDVICPSGHRIGTAEVESALVSHSAVAEAAVVGFPHDIKGEGIGCFVILRDNVQPSVSLTSELKSCVRDLISPIATPDFIVYSDLPKTRSGKIMRRIVRKVAAGEEDSIGDTSTLADPSVVPRLVERFREAYGHALKK